MISQQTSWHGRVSRSRDRCSRCLIRRSEAKMCRHSAGEMGEARGRDRRWTTESSETKTNQRGGSQPGESEWVSMVSRSQVLSEWCGSLRSDARAATASGVTFSPDPSVVNGKGKLGLKETRIWRRTTRKKKNSLLAITNYYACTHFDI